MRNIVLSLCDLTGNFTSPWVDAGFEAVLVDPQHGITHQDGPVLKVAATVLEALPLLAELLPRVAFVAGWPPCTDMAVSGARWFESKRQAANELPVGNTDGVCACRVRGEQRIFGMTDWWVDALCAEVGGDFWHPEKGESAKFAKSICAECPVTVECLEDALRMPSSGIRAGLTERERRGMKPAQRTDAA